MFACRQVEDILLNININIMDSARFYDFSEQTERSNKKTSG